MAFVVFWGDMKHRIVVRGNVATFGRMLEAQQWLEMNLSSNYDWMTATYINSDPSKWMTLTRAIIERTNHLYIDDVRKIHLTRSTKWRIYQVDFKDLITHEFFVEFQDATDAVQFKLLWGDA